MESRGPYSTEPVSSSTLAPASAIQEQTDKEVLIAEYETLRNEINTNSQVASQAATVAVTAVIAFITFGLDRQNWEVFLAPAILVIISVIFVTSQYDSTARIAAFIRRRHEEGDLQDLKWESALTVIRTRLKRDRPTINFISSLAFTFLLLQVASCGLSIYFFWTSFGSPLAILLRGEFNATLAFAATLVVGWAVLLTLSFVVIYRLSRVFSGARFRSHYESWHDAFAYLDAQKPGAPTGDKDGK